MEKLRQQIEQRLSAVMGDACFYYENPVSYTHLTLPTNSKV